MRRWVALIAVACIAAASGAMLQNLSAQLGAVRVEGFRSYDAKVFTNAKWHVLDTRKLANAIELWKRADKDRTAGQSPVQSLLTRHILLDAAVFTPAFSLVLWLAWRACVRERARIGDMIVLAEFCVDELENLATFHWVSGLTPEATGLTVLQCLTLIKWILIVLAVGLLAAFWLHHQRRRKV